MAQNRQSKRNGLQSMESLGTGSYCIVLYCTVLSHIISHCIVYYCIVQYSIVLYCIVLYRIVLNCIVLCCVVQYGHFLLSVSLSVSLPPSHCLPLPICLPLSFFFSFSFSFSVSFSFSFSFSLLFFSRLFHHCSLLLHHFLPICLQIPTATIGLYRCPSAAKSQRWLEETVRARYELCRTVPNVLYRTHSSKRNVPHTLYLMYVCVVIVCIVRTD